MTILEVKNLVVDYGSVRAVHGIDISIEKGSIVTILGANGAGKSSTVNALSGLIAHSADEIVFNNRNIKMLQ